VQKLGEELKRIHLKLHNEEFLKKARPEAVEKEREKARVLTEKSSKMKEGLERIQAWRAEA
jgi:valyl-tRNA synthetase